MRVTVFLLVLGGLFMYMQTGDYEAEIAEASYYCDMVSSGAWPNYDEREC